MNSNRCWNQLAISFIRQSEYHVSEADEPYFSFVENALNKARHVSRLTGKPALADDSGLCADALGGSPGVLSARYAGEPKSDLRNNRKLISDLASYTDKAAQFLLCSGLRPFGG